MSERRAAQRQRVLKAASIEFDGKTVDCTLRNISRTGAALSVTSGIISHEFTLKIVASGIRRNCRVVWRKQTLIGLAFDTAA